jgi:hypothetical protein
MKRRVMALLNALEEIQEVGYSYLAWDLLDTSDLEKVYDSHGTVLHRGIPSVIADMARDANVTVHRIYHLIDGVKMPEYLVLVEWNGEKYTLELDIIDYILYVIGGTKGWIEIPPCYHPVYPF